MKLSSLINTLNEKELETALFGIDPDISSIHYDSRDVVSGGLFVAIKGFAADGHRFIDAAVKNGASAVVCETPATTDIPMVQVKNSRKALAVISRAFFNYPDNALTLMGITGTNGKTTVSYIVESILDKAGINTGVIGTINYRFGGRTFDNPVTTPESLDLSRILSQMADSGVTHVVMEVSSHALDLYRVYGFTFHTAIFTNLSQDHLDFHEDMQSYWSSKQKLFHRHLAKAPNRAVINIDDPRGKALAKTLGKQSLPVGMGKGAMVTPENIHQDLTGTQGEIRIPGGKISFNSPLVGGFNLENIMVSAGAVVALGIDIAAVKMGIESMAHVPGRLEAIPHDKGPHVYVDYAHTPDALENALKTIRHLTRDRIITVFGCGGDRDSAKRPLMGEIAGTYSDLSIITSDNPRSEDPMQIIGQIKKGIMPACSREYSPETLKNGWEAKGFTVVSDRKSAICLGIGSAGLKDAVVIAGKGHETYQILKDKTIQFDDRIQAKKALASRKCLD